MASLWLVIDDHAAPQGFSRGGTAQDVAIAAHRHDRLTQLQLDPTFLARVKLFRSKESQHGNRLARADKELYLIAMFHGCGCIVQEAKAPVQTAGGLVLARVRNDIPAADGGSVDARDVDRGARAGNCGRLLLFMRLQSPDAPLRSQGQDFHFIAQRQAAVTQRPCHHRAETAHGEDAVDGQARTAEIGTRRFGLKKRFESRKQRVKARSRFR